MILALTYKESEYALKYQPISSVAWNFSVIKGIAVVIMLISRAIRNTASARPTIKM